jgi:beta-lactam-binding protein with PASTA domain/serine/threonine protein kinase
VDTTAADPLVGALLEGRYRVGPRIARGGMATVYEATDTRLDRVVAVKVMHTGYADDEHFIDRFVREARSAARLSHPHVVGVFDQGEDNGTLFLAMEYVPGCTLRDVINEQGALPPSRALALLEPMVSALAAAHDAGIVHRDVKPENVLLTDDGRVKVADFGLARAVTNATSTATSGGVLIGTVSYIAPELVTDGAADARSDVYSAGVLLYELLTGRKPHQGETPIQIAYKHVHEDVPAPSLVVEGIPAYLDALVARSTARQRDSRPADAKVFLHQLRRVRHALDHGVLHDPELTEDLSLLTRDGQTPEPTRVVPREPYGDWPHYDSDDTGGSGSSDHDGHATAVAMLPRAEEAEGRGRGGGHAAPGRRRSRKRMWGWVALAVVLLLAAGAGVGGWYLSVGRYIQAPDLTGMSLAQAQRQLRPTQLDLRSGPRTYSETVPEGDIVSTEPQAGSRLLRDGTITVVVSRGKERYPMPGVLGISEEDARNALEANNLTVDDVSHRFSETVEEGLVVSASEQEGTKLRPDAEVDLVVSKGREPIDVPSVVGASAADARAALTDLGLQVGATRQYDAAVPKNVVVSQTPTEGTLYQGDTVDIVVSQGPPLAEVPSVFGQHSDDAVAALEGAGFVVSVQQAPGYVGFDLVSSQTPSPATMAPAGSTVTIYLH